MKVDPLQKLRCHGGCCPFVEKHSVALDLLAYENILRNREIAQKVKLLVYHGDSKCSCIQHRVDFGLTTVKNDFASIRRSRRAGHEPLLDIPPASNLEAPALRERLCLSLSFLSWFHAYQCLLIKACRACSRFRQASPLSVCLTDRTVQSPTAWCTLRQT